MPFGICSHRNCERDRSSSFRAAPNPNAAAVGLHEALANGQAQAGSRAAVASPATVEALKRFLQMLLGNTFTVIDHFHFNLPIRFSDLDLNRTIIGGILQRIIHQVDQHLSDENKIQVYQQWVRWQAQANGPAPGGFA
jgi:hypothetical protein